MAADVPREDERLPTRKDASPPMRGTDSSTAYAGVHGLTAGDVDGVGEGEGVMDGDGESEGEGVLVGETDGVPVGVTDGVGLALGEGSAMATVPFDSTSTDTGTPGSTLSGVTESMAASDVGGGTAVTFCHSCKSAWRGEDWPEDRLAESASATV